MNKKLKNFFASFLCMSALFGAEMPPMMPQDNSKIVFQNVILTHVNDTAFSMMDVKKKMDLLFHQYYPHLVASNQARYQFYETSWRPTLMQMIDNELILADASEKEMSLSDGEVREELEKRFGPNVLLTLDQIGINYEEAWKAVKNDLILQRMNWFFVHSKALQKVTPHSIREAYQKYAEKHPSYTEWTYQVLSIDCDVDANVVYERLVASNQSPDCLENTLAELNPSLKFSRTYTATDQDLSLAHQEALASLPPQTYSQPLLQKNRVNQKSTLRIFYLHDKVYHATPSFKETAAQLQEELTQQAMMEESQAYLQKLRARYGFDVQHLESSFPEDMKPFALR